MFKDPIIEKTDKIDKYKLLVNLDVPLVLNLTSNSLQFNLLAVKAFMAELESAGVLTIDYYASTEFQIKTRVKKKESQVTVTYRGTLLSELSWADYKIDLWAYARTISKLNPNIVVTKKAHQRMWGDKN